MLWCLARILASGKPTLHSETIAGGLCAFGQSEKHSVAMVTVLRAGRVEMGVDRWGYQGYLVMLGYNTPVALESMKIAEKKNWFFLNLRKSDVEIYCRFAIKSQNIKKKSNWYVQRLVLNRSLFYKIWKIYKNKMCSYWLRHKFVTKVGRWIGPYTSI